MSLTRKMLKGMSLTEEQIDTIIEAHTETVDALKADRDKYKAQADKLPALQEQVDKAEQDPYEDKYNALKEEYDSYKADVLAKETRTAKEKALREVLKDANLTERGIEKALKYTDWDKVELEDSGALKDAKAHVKAVREEWAEYIRTTETHGAGAATPPSNNGGKPTKTKEEILAIKDTAERQKAIAENHTLFGI